MKRESYDPVERMRLYELGLSDQEIGEQTGGVDHSAIFNWRKKRGLAPNNRSSRMTIEARARRLMLYQLGWGDKAISRSEGINENNIAKWRTRLGLRANFRHGVQQRRNPRPDLTDVLGRVRRALGRYLPRDIADDAAGDLLMSLIDGTIPLGEIEREARRYGNRVLDRYANKFKSRSIDETIAGTEDLRMIDLLPDERSSSWLEEMGATVW